MSIEAKPIEYRLSIFHSEDNDPVDYDATTPFPAISVGDFIDKTSWTDQAVPYMHRVKVTEVLHSVRSFKEKIMTVTVLKTVEASKKTQD